MKAFYCDRFVLPLPAGHRFPMAKYRLLRERLLAEAIVSREDLLEPPAAAWEDLALVHAPGYLRQVASGTLPADHQRRIGFPWSSAMVERSRRSVGATIEAARAALAERTGASLAGGTHHAFRDRGEGYCVFNDVAVAARVLMRDGAIARPAIVDCDVHQGNGTAAIFAGDEAVFTCSLHGEKNFPFRKERGGLDVMLPDGTADAAYLDALARALEEVFARHDPDFLFYVSGADAYEGDRLGRLHLSIEGLRRRDELVFERAGRAGVPVAVVMGGGYAEQLEAVVTIHANTISTAASHAVHQPRRSAHARPIAPAARATPPIGWEPANG
jgi:acetoin utilization deacetylase AcuC-like enzyme